MNTHKVLRPFEGSTEDDEGKKVPYQYKAGELVDASTWRNTEGLIQGRYLAALPEEDRRTSTLAVPVERPRNRIQQAAQAAKEA